METLRFWPLEVRAACLPWPVQGSAHPRSRDHGINATPCAQSKVDVTFWSPLGEHSFPYCPERRLDVVEQEDVDGALVGAEGQRAR